jgi:hypothetical protein
MRHFFILSFFIALLIANDLEKGLEAISEGNFPKAKTYLQKACDEGNTKGCFGLGLMHYRGDGVEQNYSQAAMLYRKACDGGEVGGCFNLATMYDAGIGVQQSKSYAKKLFKMACDMTHENGCAEYELLVSQGY